jgi:ABC-type glycerol-3-phosphate transport system permease component
LRLYGPPGSENNHWYEASSIFSQGKAAMYTDANSLFPVIEDAQKSKVVGKVGYALFPKGPKGQYGSTVAAWGLAMPESSKNQKAAWLFMQWATAKDQVIAVQSEKGVLGARESVWKDPKGSAKVPADLKESLTVGSKVGTPRWNPPVVAVAECRDAIGAAIVTSIQGGDVKALPAVAVVAVLMVFPVAFTLYMSVHSWYASSLTSPEFVGLANFKRAFVDDERFRNALWLTIYFTVLATALQLVLGVAVALPMVATPVDDDVQPDARRHVDGASTPQMFWHITLPLLRPTIVVAMLFRAIDCLKTFDIIYVMTQGGPGFASETLNVYTFQVGLFYFHIGYASSLLVILFALVLGVSLLLIKVRRGSW